MSLARVHAVLAAGVEHPRLLEHWRETPNDLRALGIAPETLDLDALGKFAGLSVKVRHNPLRALLPLSFRLMSVAALEIEVFSAYAAQRSQRGLGYAPTMPERARDLLDFIGEWHDPNVRIQSLLWDAMRYEYALAQLGPWFTTAVAGAPAEDAANDRVTEHSVSKHRASRLRASKHRASKHRASKHRDAPSLRGESVLLELQSNPNDMARVLHASAPDLTQIDQDSVCLCVWRAPDSSEVAVLALDEFGLALLAEIDGARTAQALARRLGGGRGATAAVREALRSLAEIGIAEIDIAEIGIADIGVVAACA
jgi:hypothetical protein